MARRIVAGTAVALAALLPLSHAADVTHGADESATDRPDTTVPVAPDPPIRSTPRMTRSDADCAERLRRYRESQECFAPYRMANGGLRPEAFQLCGPDLPDPAGECPRVDPN